MSDHNHSDCHVSSERSGEIIEQIVDRLRDLGMRRTAALDDLLGVMLTQHKPFLLSELSKQPGLKDRDQATVYRLVTKLKDLGIIRQLSFGEKGNFFELNIADHHHDYLLCRDCGELSEVPFACVLQEVEEKLSSEHGWKNVSHSLAFQGVCPDCATG